MKKHPTRCNNVSKFYSLFIWSSTCFGRHTAHHQEPKTALQPLVFHTWKVVGRVVGGRCQAQCVPDNVHRLAAQQPSTYVKQQKRGRDRTRRPMLSKAKVPSSGKFTAINSTSIIAITPRTAVLRTPIYTNLIQQFFSLLSWRLFTPQHVSGVFPTTNTARLSPRYEGKTRGCHCSHWAPDDGRENAPDDGRENARNMLSCKQTSG